VLLRPRALKSYQDTISALFIHRLHHQLDSRRRLITLVKYYNYKDYNYKLDRGRDTLDRNPNEMSQRSYPGRSCRRYPEIYIIIIKIIEICFFEDCSFLICGNYGQDMSTVTFRSGSYRVCPDPYQVGPDSYQVGPDSYQVGPDSYKVGPDSHQVCLESYHVGPGSYQDSQVCPDLDQALDNNPLMTPPCPRFDEIMTPPCQGFDDIMDVELYPSLDFFDWKSLFELDLSEEFSLSYNLSDELSLSRNWSEELSLSVNLSEELPLSEQLSLSDELFLFDSIYDDVCKQQQQQHKRLVCEVVFYSRHASLSI